MTLYAVLAPVGYLMFALLSIAPTRDPARRARRLQEVMRRAFVIKFAWLRALGISRFTLLRDGAVRPRGPCVLIANHPALDDALCIMSVMPHVCTAVNATTYHRRWLRPLLASAGQFCGVSDNLLGGAAVLAAAQERLEQGFTVLVFPEGHRSPEGGLRPFARGAFEIACRTGAPVVPLLLRADPLWLGPHGRMLDPPAVLPEKTMQVLPALHPDDFGGDSRHMRHYAEAMYRRLLRIEGSADAPASNRHEADRPGGSA